ncbi:hypothetical protein HK101_000585, partial [Irineochytrium annulatum]
LHDGSLERHRPALRLAVVIPFVHSQSDLVLRNLESLWLRLPICDPARRHGPLIDLVIYSHKNIATAPHVLNRIRRAWETRPELKACFASVRFINALLTDEEDAYPAGASRMFFKLMDVAGTRPMLETMGRTLTNRGGKKEDSGNHNIKPESDAATWRDISVEAEPRSWLAAIANFLTLRSWRAWLSSAQEKERMAVERRSLTLHQAMFYMEPDVIPCRAYWLDRLYEEASVPGDFWVRGSILRDRNPAVSSWSFAEHINGNALYRLDDPDFLSYVADVRERFERDPMGYAGGFDVALHLVRKDRAIVGWARYAETAHLWQFTSTIQNWYRTGVNATELCGEERHASTYLVHGREVVW